MQPFWEIVASNALVVVFLAAGVALLGRVWKNPLCLHLLWVLVLLKLVTPPVVTVPIVLPARQAPPASNEPMANERLAHRSHVDASPQEVALTTAVPEHLPLANDRAESENAVVDLGDAPPAAEYQARPWSTVLGWMWGVGIVLFASGHAYRISRFRRLLRCGEAPSSAVLGMADGIAKRLGLGRVPRIRMLPVRVSPLVWSLGGTPRVFLPAALFERLDAPAQEAILAHELAHVRRKDHWIRLLELVVTTFFWWHPVAWWAACRLRDLEDQCCDAMVLDAAPRGAKSYATALLDTLDFLCERSIAVPLGATAARPSVSLTRRIAMLKNRTWTARWTLGRLVVLLSVAALPMAVAFGQKPPESAENIPMCDARLIGRWDGVDPTDVDRGHSLAIVSKDGGKTLQLIFVEESKEEGEPPIVLTTLQIDSQRYMIVNWPVGDRKTMKVIVKYNIGDDGTLEIRLASDDRIAEAIKAKQLRGTVEKRAGHVDLFGWLPMRFNVNDVTVTDSPEAIAEFLKTHGRDCFDADATLLLKKQQDSPSERTRAVGKLVKDFPEETDARGKEWPRPSLSAAEKKEIERWRDETWQLGIDLDMPTLKPQAVQFAILDEDPVPAFTAQVKQMRRYNRQQLERADNEARKEQLRAVQMKVSWDFGFKEITADQLYLLTKRPGRDSSGHSVSSNSPGGKKWLVTKTVPIEGKPVCWCVPVEVKTGENVDVTFDKSNTFDLQAAYDKAMGESTSAGDKER